MFFDEEVYNKVTDGIKVSAYPMCVGKGKAKFQWTYHMCIENNSDKPVQLLKKKWFVADKMGSKVIDDSVGFMGELPVLEPGETFEYTSGSELKSEDAMIYGSYIASREGVGEFEVDIPAFNLEAVHTHHSFN